MYFLLIYQRGKNCFFQDSYPFLSSALISVVQGLNIACNYWPFRNICDYSIILFLISNDKNSAIIILMEGSVYDPYILFEILRLCVIEEKLRIRKK